MEGGVVFLPDQRLEYIAGNLDAMKIGLDEIFRFHCTMCGKCCTCRENILISPRDIFGMSKELDLSAGELFQKYCEAYIGHDSRIPIVRLLPRGSARRCPLLKNRKCLVHNAKPAVCAMFPVGRVLAAENPGESLRDVSKSRLQYIFCSPGCGDGSETHTVRSWLESFGIPAWDEFYFRWQQAILDMSHLFRNLEKNAGPETMNTAWTAAFAGLYLHYDTAAEFMPQFEKNAQDFFGMMESALKEWDK